VRADVQARLEAAAAEMLAVEATYVARVSKVLVDDQAGEWSRPVQFRFEPRDSGIVELVFREVPA
jgi:hypothetical protein